MKYIITSLETREHIEIETDFWQEAVLLAYDHIIFKADEQVEVSGGRIRGTYCIYGYKNAKYCWIQAINAMKRRK